ncbi:ParB/RepB/Spo0J family partition protein [Nostoc sp. 'Peltigera membranacea cyanobiont' N6]|uniref:ParB/RepB/Spo0J family partition protein n=1 Tax=Nostoc sp. 'Peltigera membranacea cyanobiont' N6 TaxID=1261031 RepID=UPI000CF32E68|nr:ParB/RepB/Spo0J family partition protein [Nostoc sp. 'Peltigera membranacea cyanobiont' N6]AVH66236.1 chromosome/plasmid partitioning protein ParB [Nostoc sp. 'Peltigera membranacea cyanobiont' N6]
MNKPRQSLTQGLSASIAQKFITDPKSVESSQTLSIQQIKLPAKQPRRYFAPDKQSQLVQSIKDHGILEPLLVRPLKNGTYELVAGERRYRAAQEIGLSELPVVFRDLDDQQALQIALIENLQREDLNPVEETEAILELISLKLKISTEEVSSILNRANHAKNRHQQLEENVFLQLQVIESVLSGLGKFSSESFRTSRLPLLNLPIDILTALREGKIEFTKARAIAQVKNEEQRKTLLNLAVSQNLSFREIKQKIQELNVIEQDNPPTKVYVQRYSKIGKQLKKTSVWNDPNKRAKLDKLLSQLEELVGKADE